MVTCLKFVQLPLLILNSFEVMKQASAQIPDIEIGATPYGTCGDCYCIPEKGQSCPGPNPETGVKTANGKDDVSEFQDQELLNPIRLACNPYLNEFCDTQPPRQFRYDIDPEASANAVCGILYRKKAFGCPDEYALVSYPSAKEAEDNGALVTHHGACGVCSSTKDLAVMMTTRDFNTIIAECAKTFLAGINIKNLLSCIEDLGISRDCSKMLYWSFRANAKECEDVCVTEADATLAGTQIASGGPQGPPPNCTLSECTLCAKEKNEAFSISFFGRVPLNSGVLSAFAPPCEMFPDLTHDACPDFKKMDVVPVIPVEGTLDPDGETSSGTSRTSLNHALLLLFFSMLCALSMTTCCSRDRVSAYIVCTKME